MMNLWNPTEWSQSDNGTPYRPTLSQLRDALTRVEFSASSRRLQRSAGERDEMTGINAFALVTDESAMTIGAAAHAFESR